MNAPYRLGILIVVGTVLASAALCVATVGDRPKELPGPAGESLDDSPYPLGSYRFIERSGREITEADLADRVWVAGFIFTRCRMSCPRITGQMAELQEELRGSGVRLVSLSVDPEHDTPSVLSSYAKTAGADSDRWWFLTGPKAATHALILDRFKVPVSEPSEAERGPGVEDVVHSDRLALVDRGNRVVGYFDANDREAIVRLARKAKRLDNVWSGRLPTINAALNGTCAGLLMLGWVLIRSGRRRAHTATMIAAVAVSALFLACYLVYHFLVVKGSVPFQGVGKGVRVAYFSILLSHTVLAVAALPLILTTLYRAARRQFDRHARVARVTFPIWLYVSITGVVVYLMLYRMDFSGLSPAIGAIGPALR